MISAGEVGAVFTIKDEASVVLRAIAAQMNAMQGAIDKLAVSFKEIKLPKGVATAIGRIDKAMGEAAVSAGKLDKSMTSIGAAADRGATAAAAGFGRIDTAIGTTMSRLAALKKEMNSVGTPGAGGVGGGGGAWRRPGVGGGSTGHSGSAHGPVHTNMHAGPVGMRTGDGLLIGGAVAGFGLWESLRAGADLQQVQENLKGGGVSNEMIEKATNKAYDIGGKYGLTARDVLQSMNEIRNPLNKGLTADSGVEAAMDHMPALAEAMVRLKAMGEKGGNVSHDVYDLVKSAEFRNAIGDKQFDHAIKSMVDADVATGGIVTPRTWLQMSQQLKGALPGLSDDYLYTIMPELAQEFGGRQAGTAGASLYQQLVSGQMRTTGLRLLDTYDKVDKTKVEYDKNGRMVRAQPGFYKDVEQFRANPETGMAMLIQSFADKGIIDPDKQRDIMAMVFGNRTANQMANTLSFQSGRLTRGAQGIVSAQNSGVGAEDLLKNNPYTQWNEFTSAATNAAAMLGTAAMPEATAALKNLAATAQGFGGLFSGKGGAADINHALFGTGDAPGWIKWIEGNWSSDKRLFGGGSGPHPVVGPGPMPLDHPIDAITGRGGAAHLISGRDPRSPSTGTLAYSPPGATAVSVSATLNGPATAKFGAVNVVVSGQSIAAAITGELRGVMEGMFKSMGLSGTNGDSGHDGRASPAYPDHMHGAH